MRQLIAYASSRTMRWGRRAGNQLEDGNESIPRTIGGEEARGSAEEWAITAYTGSLKTRALWVSSDATIPLCAMSWPVEWVRWPGSQLRIRQSRAYGQAIGGDCELAMQDVRGWRAHSASHHGSWAVGTVISSKRTNKRTLPARPLNARESAGDQLIDCLLKLTLRLER